jgi:hypothetical protein
VGLKWRLLTRILSAEGGSARAANKTERSIEEVLRLSRQSKLPSVIYIRLRGSTRYMVILVLMLGQLLLLRLNPLPTRSTDGQTLADQARTLPAEFRADTLLRIARSPLTTQAAHKEKLIEEAYWSGSHAYLPYMQRADGRSDSIATNAVRANRLEALTLQSRAVQAMLPLNSKEALHLFEQITPIDLPKLTCSTVTTPDVIDYYQTAVLVFENSFTTQQRTQGEDVTLLRALISSVEAPAEVPPALEMIFAVKITPAQRHDLLSALGAQLNEIFRSDREYGAAEMLLVSAMSSVRLQIADADLLLPSLRSYIVRHASGHRCTDNMPIAGKLTKSAEQFNSLVDQLDPSQARYKKVSAEEAKATGDDGTFHRSLIGNSPESQAVEDAMRWLVHGERVRNGQAIPWTLEERSSQDWLSHYDDAAKLVHNLSEGDLESKEAFFCVKSDALNLLATLVPPGPTRERAMDQYLEFLESYYASIQNPNLWFTSFRHMLYTARFSEDPKAKAWILSALANSSNPIIALYARLETRIGPPSETYPPAHVKAAQERKTSTPRRQ